MRDCEVCRGRKMITLPLFKPVAGTFFNEAETIEIQDLQRDFPCPQCTEQVPYARLAVIRETSYTEATARTILDDERILEIQKRQAAHAMVDRILQDDLIVVEEVATTRGKQTRMMLGVVAPKHVAEYEERVAWRQFEIADAAVDQAIEEIANWGSFYHGRMGGRVDASQAVEWLQTALRKLKAKYGKR